MDKRNPQSQSGETVRVLVEFLEVAVTSIVHLKGIYPPGAFERRRYMNIVIHKAIHPGLRAYIHDTISRLVPFIHKGVVERIAVIFFDNENNPVERFIFKLNVNKDDKSEVSDADLQFSLRSFLIKLAASESLTKSLPENYRWEITGYFSDLPDSKEAEFWISSDANNWQQLPLITPIKSMTSQPLCIQLYLEHPNPSEPKAS